MPERRVLLQVRDLKTYFPITRGLLLRRAVGQVRAVDGVSFDLYRGETLGLVGESGSGKTTVGRSLIRLQEPTSGAILLDGEDDLTQLSGQALKQARQRLQMVFQDPYAALNPRMAVGAIVAEPLEVLGQLGRAERRQRVAELLDLVGLDPAFASRYPHEFSGGQRQRVGIARALAPEPDLIVCDEAIASLDVSIQAQVVNLLEGLQKRLGIAYLFIAHDLSMVRHISNRVAVMYLGHIMELADKAALHDDPQHPYTQALISAVPIPDPKVEKERRRIVLSGDIPSPANPPSGCVFHTRCARRSALCQAQVPELRALASGHYVACHHPGPPTSAG
ncbi:MAG: oligopeptide/dipeptide ABC transporter ATP-binding protein [Pseudomonadota bacterium]